MRLRVTYRERTTGGVTGVSRQTRDIPTDVVVDTVGGFLRFRERAGQIILMVPELCTDSVELVELDEEE